MINTDMIKKRMIDKKINQKKIAKEIGVTEVTLSRWINGKIGNIEKFLKFCEILELTLEEIKKDS